jgi:CelD/BcsL family acetyltransferase involved in cellulose biosynthesis
MTLVLDTSYTPTAQGLEVSIVPATELDPAIRSSWIRLRAANPALWSPYFDIRLLDILARYAPDAKLAIARKNGRIEALLPFQGKAGGLARPLGAPLSDQHSLIASQESDVTLPQVLASTGMAGFVFTGLLRPMDGTLKSEKSLCHVAELSDGVDAYVGWRKANWNDQVKKNERRKRQGERQWGPMRLETACPKTSTHFETLMAWKQSKYIETNRHNVLAVPWIKAYLRALYENEDPNFRGEISLLYFGDHLAALEFGLRADSAMHSWLPTFDRTYAQVSPGILLMDAMIEKCGERGITKVDLGIGHDQYKRHASNAPVEVWSGSLPLSPLRKLGSKGLVAVTRWLEQRGDGRWASLLGKLERRNEMILAAEPTLAGRARGYLAALKALKTAA